MTCNDQARMHKMYARQLTLLAAELQAAVGKPVVLQRT
jgi:hypothetical protein